MPSATAWDEFFSADFESGMLFWKQRPLSHFVDRRTCSAWNAKWAGKRAGNISKNGYHVVGVDNKTLYAHRILWSMAYGEEPVEIDHINGIGSDNRICNLRDVSHQDNTRNMAVQNHRGTGVSGVRRTRSGRWAAHIRNNGKQVHLGTFDSVEDAAEARQVAISKYGYHPNHGSRKVMRYER